MLLIFLPTACFENETAGQSSETGPHSDLRKNRVPALTMSLTSI
jgi:hypothetical protein